MNEYEDRLSRFRGVSRRVGLTLFQSAYILWGDVWLVGTVSVAVHSERLANGEGGEPLYGRPAAFLIRSAIDIPPDTKPNTYAATFNRRVLYAVDLEGEDGALPERGRAYFRSSARPLPLLKGSSPSSHGGIIAGIMLCANVSDTVEPDSCIACLSGDHFFGADRGTILVDSATVSELCSKGAL